MIKLAIHQNIKHTVVLIALLAAFLFAFAPEIVAQTEPQGMHCVGQASAVPSETGVQEPITIACFDTIEEAWDFASQL